MASARMTIWEKGVARPLLACLHVCAPWVDFQTPAYQDGAYRIFGSFGSATIVETGPLASALMGGSPNFESGEMSWKVAGATSTFPPDPRLGVETGTSSIRVSFETGGSTGVFFFFGQSSFLISTGTLGLGLGDALISPFGRAPVTMTCCLSL